MPPPIPARRRWPNTTGWVSTSRADEVVSSRDVAVARLDDAAPGRAWAAISRRRRQLRRHPRPRDRPDRRHGRLGQRRRASCSCPRPAGTRRLQRRLTETLRRKPRPLVVANPDLVAPREGGLTLEPGLYAHDLADALGLHPRWFGKPFPDAFDEARNRLPGIPAAPHRHGRRHAAYRCSGRSGGRNGHRPYHRPWSFCRPRHRSLYRAFRHPPDGHRHHDLTPYADRFN